MHKTSSRTVRSALLAIALATAALVSGCSGGGPAKASQSYVDNLKFYNYQGCYQLLAHQDQVDKTIDQFLTAIPLAPDVSRDWFKSLLHNTNYEIGETKQLSPDKAIVTVKVTKADLPLWERTIDATADPTAGPDQAAQKSLEEVNFPKVTYNDDIVTVNEGGEWKIYANYAAKDALDKKHAEGIDAYHKHDYDKSIAAYQAALANLDKDPATGYDGLKMVWGQELQEIQSIKNQIPEAQSYIPKLALSDVDMKMAASRVPGIFGKITNSGDRAIDEVICTVTYNEGKGKKKKAVYSEEHSIIVTPIEFINFSRQVLPFVPGETRSFGFKLSAPPDIQQKATPDLEITGIVFTQSKAPLPKPQPLGSASPAAAASPGAAAPPAAGGAPAPAEAPLPPPPPH